MNNPIRASPIPEGYVLVPQDTYNRFLKQIEWENIEIPSINDVSEYTGISIEKIKKDLKKYDCPLMELEKGGKGRGNIKKFIKKSAELYKDWVRK
nr:MAG TPA: 40S ribosomal protein S0-A [Caudoviricetes sp.]